MIYRCNNLRDDRKSLESVSRVVLLPTPAPATTKFAKINFFHCEIHKANIYIYLPSNSRSSAREKLYGFIRFQFLTCVSSNKNITLMQAPTTRCRWWWKRREVCEIENKWIMKKILNFHANRSDGIYWIFIIVRPRRKIFVLSTLFALDAVKNSLYCGWEDKSASEFSLTGGRQRITWDLIFMRI